MAMEWNKMEVIPHVLNLSLFFQIMKSREVDDFKVLSWWAFLLRIDECPKFLVQLCNDRLLQCDFACMANVKQLGINKKQTYSCKSDHAHLVLLVM